MEEYINKVICGDALDTIKKFADKSIDCVIASPPYWQLRDYKWEGQWGLEPTYQMYLENLWSLMDEVYRVLKDSGTCWINLGDTYGTKLGSMGALKKYKSKESDYSEQSFDFKQPDSLHKCLLLLPHRFAIGCIERGWLLRNDVVWAKRNAMPESVTDRFSKKHEYIFFFVKQEKYYFDLDSIKCELKTSVNLSIGNTTKILKEDAENYASPRARQHRASNGKSVFGGKKGDGQDFNGIYSGKEWFPTDGKNPGSVSDFWDITTKSSNSSHYAAYNDQLIAKPIIAGCPKGGVVIDMFCGTGTTLCYAKKTGRNYIGIDGSLDYCNISEERLQNMDGIFITERGEKIKHLKLFEL